MTKKNRHFVAFGPSAEIIIAFLLSCLWLGAITLAQEPTLPAGLEAEEETETSGPTLPSGLDDESAEPSLPTGLQEAPSPSAEPPQRPAGGDLLKTFRQLGLSGFWEVRGGVRTQNDPHQEQASLGETRLQLDFERILQDVTIKLVADVLYDAVFDHLSVDLERGKGWLDLRQASFSTSPLKFMDIKVGRQILTWGTGDMVFLNDLFPKDWQAFLIGRDVEYLKAPSDAMKVGLYSELANLDIVFVPRFDADRFVRGERLSYYNANLGRPAGRDAIINPDQPDEWFDDHEWHGRLWKNIEGFELAAYGYWGFWKSPAGQDPATMRATFPRLSVYGASVRGPIHGGIGNVEAAYYDSRQDRQGDDPFVDNSQLRMLAGYERDLPRIASDLTVGAQYYLEMMMQYEDYLQTLPPGMPEKDKCRHVLTTRITKKLLDQNLTLSLFAFYSPSDNDAYLRPNVQYKIDDHWIAEAGGNVFFGAQESTFFGQFGRDSNVYLSLRYGF